MIDKDQIAADLEAYKTSMSEFDKEEMEYLTSLVKADIETDVVTSHLICKDD